jgi:hypothetical protein
MVLRSGVAFATGGARDSRGLSILRALCEALCHMRGLVPYARPCAICRTLETLAPTVDVYATALNSGRLSISFAIFFAHVSQNFSRDRVGPRLPVANMVWLHVCVIRFFIVLCRYRRWRCPRVALGGGRHTLWPLCRALAVEAGARRGAGGVGRVGRGVARCEHISHADLGYLAYCKKIK